MRGVDRGAVLTSSEMGKRSQCEQAPAEGTGNTSINTRAPGALASGPTVGVPVSPALAATSFDMLFSFLFHSKYWLILAVIPSLAHRMFRIVWFSFQLLGDFPHPLAFLP